MFNSHVLDEIRTRDPVKDHERIIFLSTCYDPACDTMRALEFTVCRTFRFLFWRAVDRRRPDEETCLLAARAIHAPAAVSGDGHEAPQLSRG
jgi:hypothetical protein